MAEYLLSILSVLAGAFFPDDMTAMTGMTGILGCPAAVIREILSSVFVNF